MSLDAKRHEAVAHKARNSFIFARSDNGDQGIHASAANGSSDPEFGEMRPDRVRNCCQLSDEQMPCPMQRQARLLLRRFDRHETHIRPLHRLANRLGVGRVVLLAFDVRLHIDRRYEFNFMPKRSELANQARRQLHKKRQNTTALQLLPDKHFACRINAVNLENRLRDVETDGRDRLYAVLRIVLPTSTTASLALLRR